MAPRRIVWQATIIAYDFDDIRPVFDLLADLYAQLYLEQPDVPQPGQPYRAAQVLDALGELRSPLAEDDKRRFDTVLDKIVEMKLRASESKKPE